VAAGGRHTVLLRSDGRAVACGSNAVGQRDIPEPDFGASYYQNGVERDVVVQLLVDDRSAVCRHLLTGEALARWTAEDTALCEPVLARVAAALRRPGERVRVVLSDGSLLSEALTWEELFGE